MEPPLRTQKRRRVLIACISCRARKTKCDSKRPTCSTCAAAGEVCDYTAEGIHTSTKVLIDKEYLRSIEQRLEFIEKRAITPLQSRDDYSPLQSNLGSMHHQRLTQTPQLTPTPSSASPTGVAPPTESSFLVTADPDVFLGGDSGVSFTQLILNAMNGRDADKLQTQPFSQWRGDHYAPPEADIYVLPPDAVELMNIFFNFHYELSPIFHEPTTRAAFNKIIEGDISYRHDHRYTLSILNMMFAISASHRRSPTEPMARARFFCNTAMLLIKPTLLEDWNIEKVQALLLGARYLQSSNSPDECWNVLGLAIRIAYGLELHCPPDDQFDCIAKETRKRVWYACFVQDKLVSMIYGRPAATSTLTFTTPLPEDLDDDCIQFGRILYPTPRGPSLMSFSIQVAKLYRVLESSARLSALGKVTWDTLASTIFSLDEEFEEWSRGLPEHLKMHDNNRHGSEQALILALRANMVRILIHRQSLAVTLGFLSGNGGERRGTEGLKNNMFQYSRNICVETAMDTISLVGLRHEKTTDAVGPSWFNLYYLFNAILVVISHVIDPAYRNDKFALSRLDYAMSMINRMSISHSCAQRTYSFLKQVLSYMDKSVILGWPTQNSTVSYQASSLSPRSQPPPSSAPVTLSEQNGFDKAQNVDFFALLDITQDLAQNLGSHLESHEAMGSGMWSWVDENIAADAAINTLESNYSAL